MNAEFEERMRQLTIKIENFAQRLEQREREREKAAAATEIFPVCESVTSSTRVLMPLPTSCNSNIPMDDFMKNWKNEQQDLLSQTVVEPHDLDQQEDKIQSMSMAYHNASGKRGKIHNLNDCLHWTIFDMLMIAETWYDDSIDTNNIIAGTDFDLYRRDRGWHGGGVIIAIRNDIRVVSCEKWTLFNLTEVITLRLTDGCITQFAHDAWNVASKNGNAADSRRPHHQKVAIFAKSKAKYINENIKKSDGNRTELYKFLKSKKIIPEKMAEHLASAFAEGYSRLYEGNIEENINELWTANYEETADPRELPRIELFDIIAAINGAKATKRPGPMGFSITNLKAHVIKFARILVSILNGCYNLGWIQENWLNEKLLPIPKPGNKNVTTNYRGIAIQSVIPKLFDAIITNKLQNVINHTLSPTQHVFCHKKGTSTCLLEAILFIHEEMSGGGRVDAVTHIACCCHPKAGKKSDHPEKYESQIHFTAPQKKPMSYKIECNNHQKKDSGPASSTNQSRGHR